MPVEQDEKNVILEIPNVFGDHEEPSIETLAKKFNIEAERFGEDEPVPMPRNSDTHGATLLGARPAGFILFVDRETAAEIAEKLPGLTKIWPRSQYSLSPNSP